MLSTTIRPARPRDLPQMLTMIRALSAFHGDEATTPLARLQELFFGPVPRATGYVAALDGTLIGYAGVVHHFALHDMRPRFDIHHLFVAEAHRSRGVGKALIAAARDMAEAAGARGLTIGTDPRNAGAQAAYRAMGWKEITDAGPRFWIPVEDQ